MAAHLILSDRKQIEQGLKQGESFRSIARNLGRPASTISREVSGHWYPKRSGAYGSTFNTCANRFGCIVSALEACTVPDCRESRCRNCRFSLCSRFCPDYIEQICDRKNQPPYVCNGCDDRRKCSLEKHLYDARHAQREAEETRSIMRQGSHLSEREIAHIQNVIGPLVSEQGLSVHHAWAANKDTLMVSERCIYDMISDGRLSVNWTAMPQKVSRKQRQPKYKVQNHNYKVNPKCKENRTFEDYTKYRTENGIFPTVMMDSVIGVPGGKVLLTVYFAEAHFMLAFLRDHNDARSVTGSFTGLWEKLPHDVFRKVFPALLTDNGSEFSDPDAIEPGDAGERRTRVFYCHPSASFEKAGIEENHRMIRRICPKGKSMDGLTQQDVNLMMSHVNSYVRRSTGDKCPFDLFEALIDPDHCITDALGLYRIDPNKVIMKPSLLW